MLSLDKPAVFSLYRSYLRQIRKLPHTYLQQFFQIKARLDIQTVLETKNHNGLQSRKFKRVSKELRKLTAANGIDGKRNKHAFDYILDLAYGRKGPLRWDIMKPLLEDQTAPLPPRIIPAVEKSRPPVYSGELRALLTSRVSRTTNALNARHIISPPALHSHLHPESDAAKLLGPFSKRREVNMRWRYFTNEWKKILPPLQVKVEETTSLREVVSESASKEAVARAGIRAVGLQGTGVHEELVKIAGPVRIPPPLTRRQRKALGDASLHTPPPAGPQFQSELPNRWLRRRHRELLGRLPVLQYSYVDSDERRGHYKTTLEPNALVHFESNHHKRHAEVDQADTEWIELAETKTAPKK